MPGFDKTGPFGAGPMTGGARGSCSPATTAYPPQFFRGAGFGGSMGLGQGFRCGRGRAMKRRGGRNSGLGLPVNFNPYPGLAATELDTLKTQAESFKNVLTDLQQRIAELEKSS